MWRKILAAGILSGMMIISSICVFAADAPVFSDVNDSDWFAADVEYVCDSGLMKGVSENRFDPQGSFTRGMLVTVLHRMEGEPSAAASPFEDVEADAWYAEAVAWAAREGIVNGTSSSTFSPEKPITREQLATILYRYIQVRKQAAGIQDETDESITEQEFLDYISGYAKDGAEISEYARPAMVWAVQKGLLKGSNRKLEPKASANRAQVAAVMHRFGQQQSEVPAEDGAYYSRDGKILHRIPENMKGSFTPKEETKELSGRCAYGCMELEEIVIPEGVTEVGQEAFAMCPKLKSVRFPASLESLGEAALPGMLFKGSDQVETLIVAEGNPRYHNENNLIIDDSHHQLVLAAKRISGTCNVPEGVTWFGTGAFAGCKDLKNLVLSDTVKSINSGSLIGCSSLESIHFGRDFYLPDPEPQVMATGMAQYIPVLGREFRDCPNLKHITVSEANPHFIAAEDCLIDVDRGHLLLVPQGKTGSLTLPEGIWLVGECAFYHCSGITEIRFPESMKNLAQPGIYEGCDGVEKICLPSGIEYFYGPLEGCPNLKTIEFRGSEQEWNNALEFYWRNTEAFEKLQGVSVVLR